MNSPRVTKNGTADAYLAAALPAQIFVRAMLHRLTVSALTPSHAHIPAITVCPFLCWAAELEEWERVEIYNVETGTRFLAPVLYGERERVEISPVFNAHVMAGDSIILTAYASVPPDDRAPKSGLVVWAKDNRALEIRRVLARTVRREPSYSPLALRSEAIVSQRAWEAVGAEDWAV